MDGCVNNDCIVITPVAACPSLGASCVRTGRFRVGGESWLRSSDFKPSKIGVEWKKIGFSIRLLGAF